MGKRGFLDIGELEMDVKTAGSSGQMTGKYYHAIKVAASVFLPYSYTMTLQFVHDIK